MYLSMLSIPRNIIVFIILKFFSDIIYITHERLLLCCMAPVDDKEEGDL